jgi:hypothetical protein
MDSLPLAWCIDIWPDVDGGGPLEPPGTVIRGPRDAPEDLLAELAAGEGRPFRILDSDQLVYCHGRILTTAEAGTEDDFAPLSHYGAPGLGAVDIQYREVTPDGGHVWSTL